MSGIEHHCYRRWLSSMCTGGFVKPAKTGGWCLDHFQSLLEKVKPAGGN